MECVKCKSPLGDKPKCAPVTTTGAERSEIWCPICFVSSRAPLERGRFHGCMAVLCDTCGWKSVDFGLGRCPMCSGRYLRELGAP